MQSHRGRFEPTRFSDLTVTVDFHCHSACRFCIVQEGMNRYKGLPFELFQQAVDDNGKTPRYDRVTFTGGEVTLEKKLFDYVDYAREHGGFDHIRVQTNGRLMADMAFAERLVERGIDEFFVSLHGPDAAVQDHISQRPGSFDEAWSGLRNLAALRDRGERVTLLTNTVLTTLNVAHLRRIVEVVAPLAPARMEFWNYLPMEDYADERDLLVPMAELGPAMIDALDAADALGVRARVKYVPRCLLGRHGDLVDNTQPDVVIVEEFYDVYPKFDCLWEAKCEHAESCLGLTHPYIAKYGWEEHRLTPTPRTTEWREPRDGLALASDDPEARTSLDEPALAHPAWAALVEGVAELHGARLLKVLLDRRRCTFTFALAEGRVDVVLTKRNEARPALTRSRSFNIAYRLPDGADPLTARSELSALVRAVAEAVRERDRGQMLLDERKGLIGPDALRRPRRTDEGPGRR